MRAKTVKLTIDSNLEDVFLIGLAVNNICSHIPYAELESNQIEICVVEAVNNTIKHAYKGEAGHDVEVLVALYLNRITFQVCDCGKTIKPGKMPKLEFDPNDLENLPEGGMGLFIIHEVMDEVAYETSKGKNILTMTKIFESKRTTGEIGK